MPVIPVPYRLNVPQMFRLTELSSESLGNPTEVPPVGSKSRLAEANGATASHRSANRFKGFFLRLYLRKKKLGFARQREKVFAFFSDCYFVTTADWRVGADGIGMPFSFMRDSSSATV